MPETVHRRSGCPVVFALDVFGDRWTFLVVRDLIMRGFTTYGEFLNAGEGISTNILADRLRRLEAEGIVTKHDDPEHGARYRYRLTDKGLGLIPVLVEMIRWSSRHDPDSPVPATLKRRLEREPQQVVEELVRRARAAP